MAKVDITIESGTRELAGNLFVPQEPSGATALFFHGMYSQGRSSAQYAKFLGREGVSALTFDLSGHGSSQDELSRLSVAQHMEDARAAYDYLLSQDQVPVDPERLGIVGSSYGGYLATLLSAERPIKSLLLRSPPLYPEALYDRPRQTYTDDEALYTPPEADNPALAALRAYSGRVLLVVSEHDTVVVPAVTDAYHDAIVNGEQMILAGATHALVDPVSKEAFKAMVVDWARAL
jgi:dienelactone hydrolase